jgi:hypothetical protein
MKTWLKGIGIVAAVLIALEVVAFVGVTLLGPTAFRDMIEILRPVGEPTEAVATTLDNGVQQKCSTYRGELFCITDGQAETTENEDAVARVALSASAGSERRCAEYKGETICLEGGS